MISPVRLLLYLLALWLTLFSLNFFYLDINYSIYPTFLVFGITILFIIGSMCAPIFIRRGARDSNAAIADQLALWRRSTRARTIFAATAVAAAIGCALRFYDRFILRGLLDASSFADARLTLIDLGQSSSILSISAALLFSLSYATFFLMRTLWPALSLGEKLIGALISIYPIAEGFAQGGVIAAVSCILYYVFVHQQISIYKKSLWANFKTKKLHFLVLLLLVLVVLYLASAIFLQRIEYIYGNTMNYMLAAEQNGTIRYSERALWLVKEYGALGYIPVWISHYFTLGIHEFYYLVNEFNSDDHFIGQYQVFVALKFFKYFGFFENIGVEQFYLANPMPGHYQTFWGPAYMDFGSFVLFEALLCGLIAGIFYMRCLKGNIWGLMIYPYILVLMIVGLLANGLVGERLYFIFGLSVVALLMARQGKLNKS